MNDIKCPKRWKTKAGWVHKKILQNEKKRLPILSIEHSIKLKYVDFSSKYEKLVFQTSITCFFCLEIIFPVNCKKLNSFGRFVSFGVALGVFCEHGEFLLL